MTTTQNSSFPKLLQALYQGDVVLRQRPVQVLLLALYYWLFGLAPLGYHILNSVALLAALLIFYALLRELGQNRLVALTVSLIYGLLPNYATDRFWLAAFQATLSVTFYFLALYADLRTLRALPLDPRSSLWWKLANLAALLVSVLAYEVVFPLLVLNPLLLWFQAWRTFGPTEGNKWMRRYWPWLIGSSFVVLFAAALYKLLVSVRVGVGLESDFLSHLIYLVTGAFRVNYGTYGVGLPYILWWIVHHPPQIGTVVAALVAMGAILLYLLNVARQTKPNLRQETWGWLTLLGFVIFGLGYAIFLFNGDVWFTSAAVGNRVAIAATVGVATSYTGFIGWFSSRLPTHAQASAFVLLVVLLCGSGFMINNVLGRFWVSAYQEELRILTAIKEEFPHLAPGSTLLLDGVCPEIGAAIVFNGPVDLGGAVAVSYDDLTLHANRITPEVSVGPDGLTIGTFRRQSFYAYSDLLWVFHYPQRSITPLPDEAAARHYFNDFEGDAVCPPGFSWGWNAQ